MGSNESLKSERNTLYKGHFQGFRQRLFEVSRFLHRH